MILKLRIFSVLFVLTAGIQFSSNAQASFVDQTMVYNPDLDIRSGNCGATADLNNDGLTDIVNIDRATHLVFGYNNGPGQPFTWVQGPKTSSSREYLCLVTDFENDGSPEILTSGSFTNTKIYKEIDCFSKRQTSILEKCCAIYKTCSIVQRVVCICIPAIKNYNFYRKFV